MAEQTKQQILQDIQAAQDLFGRAHDYLMESSHAGSKAFKVAEVINFLAFQYGALKQKAEAMAKDIEIEAKVLAQQAANKVDVEAAKAAVDAVLVEKAPEAPKA